MERTLAFYANLFSRDFTAYTTRRLGEIGLSFASLFPLIYVGRHPGCTQSQLTGALGLDWAFLPIDGIYNMGPEEAARCAGLIGAGATVPIHTKPGSLYDRQAAEAFQCPGRQLLAPGETLTW